jgi:hypothetical protein
MDREIVENLSNQVSISGILFLTVLGFSNVHSAGLEVYRCTLNGETEFSQTPCREGEQQVTVVEPQSRGMSPIKPALRMEPKVPANKPKKITEKTKDKDNLEKCWRARKKLERVEQRLRAGYKASQYQRLHNRQDEYEEYLRLFCP